MLAFVGGVVRLLSDNAEPVAVGFFLCFFAAAAVAVFARRPGLRRVFVAGFLAALLVVNLSPGGFYLYPVEDLHKFSDVAPEEKVNHLMYVEDAAGRELRFDRRVVPTVSPASSVAEALATRCSPAAADAAGRSLLARAAAYREDVGAGPGIVDRLQFPRHQADYRWTPARLAPYGPFVALHVDAVRLEFAPDGRSATTTRTRVFTVRGAAPTAEYGFEDRCV
jgi:hypothetical protein